MKVDFTSARFLGFGMAVASAVPNPGKPAALLEPARADVVASGIAAGQAAEAGLLARSTLHALIDVLAVAPAHMVVLVDQHCYPVTRWAANAVRNGGTVLTFQHHDPDHADHLIRRSGRVPLVIVDAWCAGCLRPAPLAQLGEVAAAYGGRLVVDDSLAFGVLGRAGAGTPVSMGLDCPGLLWLASAGKAYGAHLAVITGPRVEIEKVKEDGPSRMHSSPASGCDIAALAGATADPSTEHRRRRLAANTTRLRRGLTRLGVHSLGWPLPVVALDTPGRSGEALVAHLGRRGVQILLTRAACGGGPRPTFCVRADHSDADLADAVDAVGDLMPRVA